MSNFDNLMAILNKFIVLKSRLEKIDNKWYLYFEIRHVKIDVLKQEGNIFLIHLFARDVLVMKKLEIEKTKPTFISFKS